MMMMLEALNEPYRGLTFELKDKDWYQTDDGCAANPTCSHDDNKKGVNIKLQISMRERPILAIADLPQITQDYFAQLGFEAGRHPSLAFEEAVAEKIRAASQRSKIRDLHDLYEISGRDLNREPNVFGGAEIVVQRRPWASTMLASASGCGGLATTISAISRTFCARTRSRTSRG